jgi:hypothetical protein
MSKIERIRDLDDEIFKELQQYFPKTTSSEFAKLYPYTSILIHLFDTSGTFIKNSIFDNCETDDYYGMKILYRCLIEHYIRFKFIFVNWSLTKSDVFAKEYLEYNDAREVLDLLRAKISEHQLFDPNYNVKDWDSFLKDHPNFKNKTRKEVEDETKKYTFKNIVRFLNEQFKIGKTDTSEFLGKLIVEYSDLSSFVHGGMKSYQEMMSTNNERKRQKEYTRICKLSFQLSNSIKLISVLMYAQTDKETFSIHYLKLDEIIRKINNHERANT